MPDEDITYDQIATTTTQQGTTIWQKLLEVQEHLKVGKEREATGRKIRYKFRSKEDILEAAKPLCQERGLLILCDDEIEDHENGWVYIVTTASVIDTAGNIISARGCARESVEKSGLEVSQVTGMASSYAGKRALGNLFSLDDTEDADALGGQPTKQPPAQGPFSARCKACGHVHQFSDAQNFNQWVAYWQQGGDQNRCCPAPTLEVV